MAEKRKTPERWRAQPGHGNRSATAAGTHSISSHEAESYNARPVGHWRVTVHYPGMPAPLRFVHDFTMPLHHGRKIRFHGLTSVVVMDWDRAEDEGWMIGEFADLSEAVVAALAYQADRAASARECAE